MGMAVLFAILGGASAAAWTICLKLGSTRINAALGAMVITGVAFFVNSIVMLSMKARGHEIALRPDAVWLLVIAGVSAAGIDIFGLLAYERGLRLTSSLIMGGTSTALVLFAGFLVLQEPVTWIRVLAIAFIAAGILLFQVEGGLSSGRSTSGCGPERADALDRHGEGLRREAALGEGALYAGDDPLGAAALDPPLVLRDEQHVHAKPGARGPTLPRRRSAGGWRP